MTSTLATASALTFAATFAAKYTKTIVGIHTYRTFKPRPVSKNPKYTSRDVSVIIPTTFSEPKKLKECVQGILQSNPRKVLIVCPNEHVLECKTLLREEDWIQVTVLGVPKLNKRIQILKALEYATTDIIVLADDDVFWPNGDYINLLLAIFEDDRVGAGGTRQRVRREKHLSMLNFLGIGYLERRTWNNATTNGKLSLESRNPIHILTISPPLQLSMDPSPPSLAALLPIAPRSSRPTSSGTTS